METKPISSIMGNTTGERIKWLRLSHGLTRIELWNKLKEKYPGIRLGATTIQGWEQGKIPRPHYITMLANFFDSTEDFLLCKTDDQSFVSRNFKENSMSELDLLHGEPVWVTKVNSEGSCIGNYALVNAHTKHLIFTDRSVLPFDVLNSDYRIYSRNMHPQYSRLAPISLEMAKTLDKVFIMEINTTPTDSRYSGYYTYNHITRCFEKEDQTIILKDSAYDISYHAYVNPPSLSLTT